MGEITALLRGQSGGVHGTVSSRLHLAGPINQIGIVGASISKTCTAGTCCRSTATVGRWTSAAGWTWSRSRSSCNPPRPINAALPLWVRFRASDYLSQPHWAVALNWNRFSVAPLMELAQHMGAQFPPGLQLSGAIDGAIGYSGQGSLQGELDFHETAVTIPGSPPLRFEQARIVLDHGHVRLTPAVVRSAGDDQAQIEADYALGQGSLDLAISTAAMKVASLRAQVSLAAVPWLEQIRSGTWSGQLHYRLGPAKAGWTGDLQVKQAASPFAASPIPSS